MKIVVGKYKTLKENENETTLENVACDIFPNQVSMEEELLTKIMEENRSLQTQSSTINDDDERMELNVQKLHMQR